MTASFILPLPWIQQDSQPRVLRSAPLTWRRPDELGCCNGDPLTGPFCYEVVDGTSTGFWPSGESAAYNFDPTLATVRLQRLFALASEHACSNWRSLSRRSETSYCNACGTEYACSANYGSSSTGATAASLGNIEVATNALASRSDIGSSVATNTLASRSDIGSSIATNTLARCSDVSSSAATNALASRSDIGPGSF